MRNHIPLLIAVSVLLIAATPLGAQQDSRRAAPSPAKPALEEIKPQDRAATFGRLDVDGDGSISQREAKAQREVQANFAKADQDGDGRLSLAEFQTIPLNRSDQPGKSRKPDRG